MLVGIYASAENTTAHASNPRQYDALWVGGTGDVTATLEQGGSVTFGAIPAGLILPVRLALITAATATNLIGLSNMVSMAPLFGSAAAVTPDDSASNMYDALYVSAVGGGTTLSVVPLMSSQVVNFTVAAGQLVPVRTALVKAATTATVIGLRF